MDCSLERATKRCLSSRLLAEVRSTLQEHMDHEHQDEEDHEGQDQCDGVKLDPLSYNVGGTLLTNITVLILGANPAA